MKKKKKEHTKESLVENGTVIFFISIGCILIVHIFFLLFSSNGNYLEVVSQNLDSDIPYKLLMFGLIIASFVPLLTYSTSLALYNSIDKKNETSELITGIIKFHISLDFLVSQITLLITITILIGAFVFIETILYKWHCTLTFLAVYIILYWLTSVVWSSVWFFGKREEFKDKNIWIGDSFLIIIYLWITVYSVLSLVLIGKYLNCYNTIWLRYLLIISSIWLLIFSVLWIIPSDIHKPLLHVMKKFSDRT